MLYTTQGWNDISSDSADDADNVITAMLIVNKDGEGSWAEFRELFARIEQISLEENCIDSLSVTINAHILTAAFHTYNSTVISDEIRKACDRISGLIELRTFK
ncbi:MAG: hypothetical protein V4611_01020 [Patescibacteria group bacterium]